MKLFVHATAYYRDKMISVLAKKQQDFKVHWDIQEGDISRMSGQAVTECVRQLRAKGYTPLLTYGYSFKVTLTIAE